MRYLRKTTKLGYICIKKGVLILFSTNNLMKEATDTNDRPNYVADIYNTYEYNFTNVIGEIKTKNRPSHLVAIGFYHVAIFSKIVLDQHKLN